MPARSLAQYKLMRAACHSKAKIKGLSKAVACEYVEGQSPKGLPKKSLAQKKKERMRH